MSHFYGTLQGMRGEATRTGGKDGGITSRTASWQGAVYTHLSHDSATGQDIAEVSLIPWQGAGKNILLYRGPVCPGLVTVQDNGDYPPSLAGHVTAEAEVASV